MRRCEKLALALLCALALTGCAITPAPEPPAELPERGAEQPLSPAAERTGRRERPEVENNGGTFVRVDEKIWFRYYDEGEIDETQLWGEFLTTRPTHPVKSTLCFYDTEGDAVMNMFPDGGFGPLWFGEDGFYLTRVTDGGAGEAYYKSIDDGAETTLCEGTVLGVSDNGRFAAVQGDGTLAVYEGTERKYRIVGTPVFCALTDDGTLLYSDGADCVERMDIDGHVEILGVLPELREGVAAYCWEFEQCLVNGNDVWCTFGAYEGTGHFLADVLVVCAELDTPSSLETVDAALDADSPYVPRLYLDADGAVCRAAHAPGDLAFPEGGGGGLIVYGEDGGEELVVENFRLTDNFGEDEESDIVQTMEKIGNAAYLTVARARRAPGSDIGWRMAFAPEEIYYLRAPFGGDDAETLCGAQWTGLQPDERELLEEYAGVWTLRAVEVEGDRGELPDGAAEYLTFREDGTAILSGTEYANEFPYREVLPAGGADMSEYGLLFTGGENDDMLWTFLEGDTLVGTVMLHAPNGADAVSRTGFYERAAG